jgi:DmsE family decaheme c-type cytochrome
MAVRSRAEQKITTPGARSGARLRRGLGCAALLLSVGLGGAPSGAEEIPEAATYIGDAECLECHDDVLDDYAKTVHHRVTGLEKGRTERARHGCESCHGPGSVHLESGGDELGGLIAFAREDDVSEIERGNAACLSCHSSAARLHWPGSPHASRDVGCTSCHQVMRNVSDRNLLAHTTELETCSSCHVIQKAKLLRNAHMPLREGAMSCSSCHAPHGSPAQALMNHDTVNDTCLSCHAGKRGPFLWEHAPVTENCLDCHDPHGSVRRQMLVLEPPRLCQQCHIETLHPTEARLPGSRFVIGSACQQCHSKVHGSNHPSGFGLTR